MYRQAELVLHSYHPLYIEKNMYFSRRIWPGSEREFVELWKLEQDVEDEDVFMAVHGAPVKLSIIDIRGNVIAYPEDIGWFDEGDTSDELHDVTLNELNKILDTYSGMLEIDVDDDYVPLYQQDKVVIRYLQEENEE